MGQMLAYCPRCGHILRDNNADDIKDALLASIVVDFVGLITDL